jgi:assimilatory nitrate reductase catalytic subunit
MGLDPGVVPDRMVETHCCFCGQQCGIKLLVKDNQVIGFEPWMDFPFNQGKLCPKGVKRYLLTLPISEFGVCSCGFLVYLP